ncbi:NADP-dependent oxidoreductase [Dyadobacter sp. CY261]|uniref:NADP-dependent oxidoreductase n=1 Tax=Dyadobacter sp. CY261 TaxID=2907203 RepID=UPI001F387CA3|nr:NADP-dependent oxidoreductase [Dyadobacter sp. CY261]MCF0074228.1 NADP-dependent oxidoreductase [Dyadobacter sp. CY261]
MMKAIILTSQGSVDNLRLAEIPVPDIGADEVLIRVKALSINPADTYVRMDVAIDWIFNGETPKILGWDVAGVVTATGQKVVDFKVGDEVFGSIRHPGHGKAYAEYVAAPASHLALKPSNISFEEAAAATLAALTAWQPLTRANIRKGDRILITAAGGGVGHYAVQIAKYLGAYVIALSSYGKRDFVLGLGADEYVAYDRQRFEDVVSDVDLALEALRDDHIARTLAVVKRGGTLISLWAMVQGTKWERLANDLGVNAYYNAVVSNGQDMKALADLLERGVLKSHISKIYPLEEIPAAHLELEKNATTGKIVISL